MNQTWSMRLYVEGDEEGIFNLDKAVYPVQAWDNREEWMKWWCWTYKHNPARSPIIWIAKYNDKITSHAAVIPIKMKIGSKIIIGSQLLDVMTHPDYRGRRIFSKLSEHVFDEAIKQGKHIVYGFPNYITSWH